MENKILVYYNGSLVGTIASVNKKYAFQYDKDWLISGFSISPFSLPLKGNVFIPTDMTFNGFFGVFADSLPDSWGNLLLDRYLKKKGIKDYDGLFRLSCVGKGGMGALEYIPNTEYKIDETIDFDNFQKESDKILSNDNDVDISLLYKFGGSSGGARPKALITLDGEEWIIKFQSRYDIDSSGLCEYEYGLACKEIGINIPDIKLFKSNINKGYFGIKRFDRSGKRKIHVISAAALLEADFNTPCADYLDLFKLTKIVTKDNKKDIEELYLRMCFNVYAHNLDDHLKNFSYYYDEDTKNYRLSPAYDMTYSNTYYGEHTTSVNHKGKDIIIDDLVLVGTKSGLKKEFCISKAEYVKEKVYNKLGKYIK